MISHRKQYDKQELLEADCPETPFELFSKWYKNAEETIFEYEPHAFALSTVSEKNTVSSRILLMRGFSSNAIQFFTNTESKKGNEVQKNKNVCALFFWQPLQQQIRIEGEIKKIDTSKSIDYFKNRPRENKIGAWASNQSTVIDSRNILEETYKKYDAQFPNEVPKPKYWGGYEIIPTYFEFWQGRPSRLHDRICYQKENDIWKRNRLSP